MNDNFNMDISNLKYWRAGIKVVAYLVYLAGALFATITFSQHVSGQFPEQPVMRFMAFAGAWANFFSLAIMPLAKEYWINGKSMTLAAWVFWAVEFVMVVFNTLAAYGSEWAGWWTALSPASPVMVVAIWGILWYLNPEAKVHQEQVDFYVQTQRDFVAKLQHSMNNEEIQKIMDKGALQAAQKFAEESLNVTIQNTRRNRTTQQFEEHKNGKVTTFEQNTPADIAAGAGQAVTDQPEPIVQVNGNGGNTGNPTNPRKRG